MARARAAAATRAHDTRALLVRRVVFGETDLVVTFFSEKLGRVSALARGARKSQKRFGGALEPMHTLGARLDERTGAELLVLREARIDHARRRLTSDLERMQAAGRALGWVRRVAPPRTPEPEAWSALENGLNRLDASDDTRHPTEHLAELGLCLLVAFGWGLDLERCVRCGRSCEPGRAAYIDPARGGLVCRACGGARIRLDAALRERLARAARGEAGALHADDAELALELAELGLRAHAGVE